MSNLKLTEDQKNAHSEFFKFLFNKKQKVMVIAGYAGTGKSTLLKQILKDSINRIKAFRLIDPEFKMDSFYLTATTHKAAAALSDILGMEVNTVFKELKIRPNTGFPGRYHRYSGAFKGDLLIVDEASFINHDLLKNILDAAEEDDFKVLFIGDPAQLLPVGSMTSPVFDQGYPTATLKDVVRQAEDSPIRDLVGTFREAVGGSSFKTIEPDGQHILHLDRKDFDDAYINHKENGNDVKLLAWTNKTVNGYDAHMKGELIGHSDFRVGDVVYSNRYTVIDKVKLHQEKAYTVTKIQPLTRRGIKGWYIHLDNGGHGFQPEDYNEVTLMKHKELLRKHPSVHVLEELDSYLDLRSAYAITINKSQGSTYEHVYIDLDDLKPCAKNPEHLARLLYVASSRASKTLTFTGDVQ
jgi:ATP-dependent exoDNAse (exonuclease V) alpha subunit